MIMLCPTAVAAQAVEPGVPREMVDENGVDLATGRYIAIPVSISIGNQGGLTWKPGRDDLTQAGMTTIYNTRSKKNDYYVSIAGKANIFTLSGTTFIPVERDGSSLSYSSASQEYSFTNSSGDVMILRNVSNTAVPWRKVQVAPVEIRKADKTRLKFKYDQTTWTSYGSSPPSSMRTNAWSRLSAVVSDSGYSLTIAYQQNSISSNQSAQPPSAWFQPSRMELSRTSGCSGSASQNCTTPTAWPRIDIGGNGTTYTDALGRVTTVDLMNGLLTGIRLPGSSSNDVSIGYAGDKVSSVTTGGVTTGYAFSESGDTRTVTVTRGSLPARVRSFRISTLQLTSDQWKADPTGPTYTRSYSYDTASALLTRITEPEGDYTQFAYDGRGNVIETRRVSKTPGTPPDIVTSATYDAGCTSAVSCNKPIATTDARGYVTNYTYDPTHGGVTSVTAPATDPAQPGVRPETRFSYAQLDNTGAPSSSGAWVLTGTSACASSSSCAGTAAEQRTMIGYGYGLNPTAVTKGAGNGAVNATTAFTYDRVGNVIATDGPLPGAGDTQWARFDLLGRLVGISGSDPDGSGNRVAAATRVNYNPDGTVQSVEQGTDSSPGSLGFQGFSAQQQTYSYYDAYHRKVKDVLAFGGGTYALTQQSYDAAGRINCTVTRMDPGQWHTQGDPCAPQIGGAAGPDRVVQRSYDAAGQVVAITKGVGTADQSVELFRYSPNGKLWNIRDGAGNRTSFEYDGFDRPLTTHFPLPSPGVDQSNGGDYEAFVWDATGNLVRRRLRSGQSINRGYDGLNRMLNNSPDGERGVAYRYDLLGRLVEAAYDAPGSGDAVLFGYDALDQQTSSTTKIRGVSRTLTYGYDQAGNRTSITHPDGTSFSMGFDLAGAMTNASWGSSNSGTVPFMAIALDSLERRTDINRGSSYTGYSYDPVSRLTVQNQRYAQGYGNTTVSMGYNAAAQITSRSNSNEEYAWRGAVNVARTYQVNGLNQYTAAGPATFSYDARGNLTSDGTNSYGYDLQNRMTSASTAGGTTLVYDPLGRLSQMSNARTGKTQFLYDGSHAVAEYDGDTGAIRRRYFWGPGADEPILQDEGGTMNCTGTRFLHGDERGSVVGIADCWGNRMQTDTYSEHGIPAAINWGRFQFTGQAWLPELGLYYYKARMYSPTLGRFMQTDPIGYAAGSNWYDYALGDPVNLTDPSGLDPALEASCPPGQAYNSVMKQCEVTVPGQRFAPPGSGTTRPHPAPRNGRSSNPEQGRKMGRKARKSS